MKQYLIDFFRFNDTVMQGVIKVVEQLPDSSKAMTLLSHLVNAQNRWLNRVLGKSIEGIPAWMETPYPADVLKEQWAESVNNWIALIESTSEEALNTAIVFSSPVSGNQASATIQEMALQVNYHSIHHRAQINTLISAQGFTPPPSDYILTVMKKV